MAGEVLRIAWTPRVDLWLKTHGHKYMDHRRLLCLAHRHVGDLYAMVSTHSRQEVDEPLFTHPPTCLVLVHQVDVGQARVSIFGLDQVGTHQLSYNSQESIRSDLGTLLEVALPLNPIHTLQSISFRAIPRWFTSHLCDVVQSLGFPLQYDSPCYLLALPDDHEDLGSGVGVLPDIYVDDRLELGDADLVNSTWAYKSNDSLAMIHRIIEGGCTSCVRLRASGEAVSWAVQYEDGSLGMLFTQESHRRQGLGKWVMSSLIGRVRALGQPVYCYSVQDNLTSVSMMTSLGFKNYGVFHWIGCRRGEPGPTG